MSKTLTRADLSEAVHRQVGLSRTDSAELVKEVLDCMSNALAAGENVKLSSFGTFMVRTKKGRMGRNPKTGDKIPVDGKRLPFFKCGKDLREHLNRR